MNAPAQVQATNARRLLAGLGLLPVLGIGVVLLSLVFGARGQKLLMVGLATCTGLLALTPLVLSMARPPERRHLLFALLGLVHIVFFVVPVFTKYLVIDLTPPWILAGANWLQPPMLIVGQLAVLLALICLMIGYAIPVGHVVSGLLPAPRRDWSTRSTLTVACIGIPVGWVLYLATQFGLVPGTAGAAFLNPISRFTLTGFILLTLVYLRSGARAAVLLMLVLTPITMGFNFFTGSKGKFFGPLIMIFLTLLLVERRIRLRWAAALAVAVILFFPAAQYYRHVVSEGLTRTAVEVIGEGADEAVAEIADFASGFGFDEWVVAGFQATATRFDGLGILSIVLQETPEQVPFQGGWTLGYAAIFWVPRIFWPGKPDLTIGRWVTDHYTLGAGSDTSTGCTWIGELYLNFGWVGIGLGMLLLGIFFRVMHEVLLAKRATIPSIMAGVSFVNSCVRPIGGTLLAVSAGTFFSLAPALAMHLVVRFLGGTVPIERSEGDVGRVEVPVTQRLPGEALNSPGPSR